MDHSPDILHHVRLSQASFKASNIKVQLGEYNAHKKQVDEYKLDMYNHLFELDRKTRPNLSLIQQQPEINLRMRPVLLDFLMDVINKLNLSKSTFPLTVNIIDRYCSVRIVKKQHYQLLGLTALWIACKNLDSKYRIPQLSDLCKYCCHCYDKKLFLEMENHVLKSFSWLVDAPTFDSFIDFYIHSLASSRLLAGSKSPHKTCNDIKILAIYICELIQFYPNIYFNYTTPQIALVAFAIACMVLDVCKASGMASLLSMIYDSHSTDPILSDSDFDSAFTLLIKVLKCPPPSLKAKYFNEDSRFLSLMKVLVSFTWKHLAHKEALQKSQSPVSAQSSHHAPHAQVPAGAHTQAPRWHPSSNVNCTPLQSGGSTTPKYPITPMSSSLTPKSADGVDYTTQNIRIYSDPQHAAYVSTLPSPNLSPGDLMGSVYSQPAKRSYDGDAYGHKRSKSNNKAVFYVH